MLANARILATLPLFAASLLPAQEDVSSEEAPPASLEKLEAFARTYGYVRFFHPSDAASLVDWNSAAAFGARESLESTTEESTADFLRRIFAPITEGLELYPGEERPAPAVDPEAPVVAWHHNGIGALDSARAPYRSERIGRALSGREDRFGSVRQTIDAKPLRGAEIRYRFQARVLEGNPGFYGWLKVLRTGDQIGLHDRMEDRPILGDSWQSYEIGGVVSETAESLTLGWLLFGSGVVLADDVVFEKREGDAWTSIELRNPGFESGVRRPMGWQKSQGDYESTTDAEHAVEGKRCLRLASKVEEKLGGFLDFSPSLGEVIDAEVAPNLRLRLPLALPIDTRYARGDDAAKDAWIEELSSLSGVDPAKTGAQVLCTGSVVVTWNVFQHFYPYFDQVETDWDRALTLGLQGAFASSSRIEATRVLRRLVAQLHDGHGNVFHPREYRETRYAPVQFAWIEDQLVVTASRTSELSVGDVIVEIAGESSGVQIRRHEEEISGSPQFKRHRACASVSRGVGGETLALTLERDGERRSVEVPYSEERWKAEPALEVVQVLRDEGVQGAEVIYIDLDRADEDTLRPWIERMSRAKGLIFDLRGYPKGTHFVLRHLTGETLESQKWMVPQQVRPDREDMTRFDLSGRWNLPPLEPRFVGNAVFLTDASAISYAESVMAIVANYKLGEIVGAPTAGANGNINPFGLPGGWRISWTGMRVQNHDGSQHHVRGVQPTVPCEPTLEGIRAGRDELIEKALEILGA